MCEYYLFVLLCCAILLTGFIHSTFRYYRRWWHFETLMFSLLRHLSLTLCWSDTLVYSLMYALHAICVAAFHPHFFLYHISSQFVILNTFAVFQIPLRLLLQWQLITHQHLRSLRQPTAPSAGFPDRCWVAMQLRRRERAMETATGATKIEGRETRLNWSLTSLMSESWRVFWICLKAGDGRFVHLCVWEQETECDWMYIYFLCIE